jgi:hypothetical protein
VRFAWLYGTVPFMGLDLNRLLEIRLFQAFDVDESGRSPRLPTMSPLST